MKDRLSRYSILLLLIISLLPLGAKTPSWVKERPIDKDYYIGIGIASKQDDNRDYIQFAKDAALKNLASEITVNINSEVVSSMIEKSGVLEEEIRARIESTTKAELEEYELVDTWEDKKEYWVYYQLSRERYRMNRKKKIDKATALALDFYEKAIIAEQKANPADAFRFYIQALLPLEKYINEPLLIEYQGEEIYLGNEIYSNLTSLAGRMTMEPVKARMEAKANKPIKEQVKFKVSYQDDTSSSCVSGYPLKFSFLKGAGDLVQSSATNSSGIGGTTVSRITVPDKMQLIKAETDINKLTSQDSTSFIFQQILSSLQLPEAKVILSVSGLTIYVEFEEKNFGKEVEIKHIEPVMKEKLAELGYTFTEDPSSSDIYLTFRADSREGGSAYNMYTAYVDLNISAVDMESGEEVYKNSLSKIKGIDLELEKAGLKALDNAAKKLTQKVVPEMVTKF